MNLTDSSNLVISGATPQALDYLETALHQLRCYTGDPVAHTTSTEIQTREHSSNDLIVTADGRKIPNPVAVQRAKLRVNYRKWIASKLLPRKYGNNAQLEAAVPPPPPPPPNGGLPVLTKEMLLHLQERRRRALEADRLHNPHTFKTPPPPPQG